MLYRDEAVDRTPEHIRKFGGFNHAPPHFQPCSAKEFWQQVLLHGFGLRREYRQFAVPQQVYNCPAHGACCVEGFQLFYYDGDQGFAVTVQQHTVCIEGKLSLIHEPRFYRFHLCKHEMEPVARPGRCLHRMKCKHCDYETTVDSSG